MTTKPKCYRQGDVLIMRVDKLPNDIKPAKRDQGRLILAYGEVTGHSHAIESNDAKGWLCGDVLYLALKKEVDITHQEHGTITLRPGIYHVVHQHEYRRKEIIRSQD